MSIIFERDEFTWQDLLYQLVRSEQMDPWNIDVSLVTRRFIQTINVLDNLDFRLSGKVVLAASILLKLKTENFYDEDLNELDKLFNQAEDNEMSFDQFEDDFMNDFFDTEHASRIEDDSPPNLKMKTPQPRKRKVSVYDLVDGLEKALNVYERKSKRKLERREREEDEKKTKKLIKDKKNDINRLMGNIFSKVNDFFNEFKRKKVFFSDLISDETTKEDKIMTFMPLVFLSTREKVKLHQEEHFGDIQISLHPNFNDSEKNKI